MTIQAAPPATHRFGLRDFAIVVVMNVLWGLNIIAVKMAVTEIAPMTAGFLRQVIVFAVCASWFRLVPGRTATLALLGLLSGGIFYLVINLSLSVATNIGAGDRRPAWRPVRAAARDRRFFRERIHWPRMLGIGLSILGVVLLVFDPSAAREGAGLALTALASLIWAITSLIQRRLVGVPVLTIYAWVGLMGSLVMAVVAMITEPVAMRAIPDLPLRTVGWVAFSAIGSTVIGQGSMSWLLQRHSVSVVTPMTLAAPIISVFAAAYYFGNPLTLLMLAGGGVAMLGVAIVTIRTARADRLEGKLA